MEFPDEYADMLQQEAPIRAYGLSGVSLRIRIDTYASLAGLPSPFSPGHEKQDMRPVDSVGAPDIVTDPDRLREIAALGLATPEVDAILKEIAEEAASRLGLPISLVSVVLDEAQFFAASHGLDGWLERTRGTPVEWSFCANAVRSGEAFVVEDALSHPVVRDNPLVTQDGIRCYAGIPLVSSRGFALGTLCVLGTEQRSFPPEDLDTLRELAERAVQRIESRRPAASD